MHKNRLQEYTQKSGLPFPSYSISNEGEQHVPRFRATVIVDGKSITSPYTFFRRKDSEQDVAKHALEWISLKIKNEGSYHIHKDPLFCKQILNEYGAKLKLEKPAYNTIQQNGLLPKFITTVIFDGKTYVGLAGKSKKEAEQNAVCIVIDSILASSNAGDVMAQIIKTKSKLYVAIDNGDNVGSAYTNDGANNANRGSELETSTNGSLPSLSLPVAVVDSQAIIPMNKRSIKQQGGQSKRLRAYEHLILVENSFPIDAFLSISWKNKIFLSLPLMCISGQSDQSLGCSMAMFVEQTRLADCSKSWKKGVVV